MTHDNDVKKCRRCRIYLREDSRAGLCIGCDEYVYGPRVQERNPIDKWIMDMSIVSLIAIAVLFALKMLLKVFTG